MKYPSGEEIKKGDRVTYHGEKGEIELVANPELEDLSGSERWYVQEHGGGVLIREPKVFGLVFVRQPNEDEDLVFVSRAAANEASEPTD